MTEGSSVIKLPRRSSTQGSFCKGEGELVIDAYKVKVNKETGCRLAMDD